MDWKYTHITKKVIKNGPPFRRRADGAQSPSPERLKGKIISPDSKRVQPWIKAQRIREAKNPGPNQVRVRGGKPKYQDVIILNTSGEPRPMHALKYYNLKDLNEKELAQPKGQKMVRVAAFVGQEHHASKERLNGIHLAAKGLGWKLQRAPAVALNSGTYSAGVCVATRSYINIGLPAGWSHDVSPAESPGGLAAAWAEGILKGGVLIVSAYLWHSEAMSTCNRSILD